MMVAIFAAVTLALALGHWGPARWATLVAVLALVLAVALFLDDIHSRTNGFAMPWLKVERGPSAAVSGA